MRISDWSSDVCSSDRVDIKSDDAQALASSAWYLANLGQADAVRELLARAEALGTERGEVSLWAAQALARLGDIEQARQRLGTARKEGIDPGRIRASPILRGLADASLSARGGEARDRKSKRLNSSHECAPRMPSSARKKTNKQNDRERAIYTCPL